MRRFLPSRVVSLTALARAASAGLGCAAAACSSSNVAGPVGPVFTFDGGGDAAMDFLPETGTPADADATTLIFGDGGIIPPPSGDATTTGFDGGHEAAADTGGGTGIDAGVDAKADAAAPGDAAGDAAHDASGDAGSSVCPGGTGTVALLGGTGALAFADVSVNGGAFSLQTLASETVVASPSLAAVGTGLLGVFAVASDDVLQSTVYTPGAAPNWSTPTRIQAIATSDASATATGAPSLAVVSSGPQIVYYGSNGFFYHGTYTAGAWGPASDPVGGTVSQDFGPSQPAAAASGAILYAAYDGSDHGLYVDTWTVATGWAGAAGITGAGVGTVPPTLVALRGGPADLMLLFAFESTNLLYSVVHTPGSGGTVGSWSSPLAVGAAASAVTQASVAPLAAGGAVVVYESASDGFARASVYSPTAPTAWTTPVLVLPTSTALAAPPTVAPGTCGVDAIAAVVDTNGIEVVSLQSGAWSAPVLVDNVASITSATVATLP